MLNWLKNLLHDSRPIYVGHLDDHGLIDKWPLSIDARIEYAVLRSGDWKPVVTIRESEKRPNGADVTEICFYEQDARRLIEALKAAIAAGGE